VIQFYVLVKKQSTEGDRLITKLPDAHVNPKKIKKMKISIAAQVFSQHFGATMKRMAIITIRSKFMSEFMFV